MKPYAAALALALGACTHWGGDLERTADQSGRDFRRDPDAKYAAVELDEIAASPGGVKFVNVAFTAILNRRHERVFVPYYSTFRPEDFLAFSVWPPKTRVWDGEERARTLRTVYLRKDNPDLEKLLRLERYTLLSLRGRVMGDYEGLPFIRVSSLDVLEPAVYDDPSLERMRTAMDTKHPAKAIDALESALTGRLGAGARVLAHLKLGGIYLQRGGVENLRDAVRHYAAAAADDPRNAEAAAGLAESTRQLKDAEGVQQP